MSKYVQQMIQVDRNTPVPLYRQLKEQLRLAVDPVHAQHVDAGDEVVCVSHRQPAAGGGMPGGVGGRDHSALARSTNPTPTTRAS